MSSKYLTILLAVAAIMLTNSCSSDDMDNILAESSVSAQVTASISNGNTATRISNTSATSASFTQGDVINVVAAETNTYQYTKQSTGSWSATTPYYFTSTSSVSFKGWYAYPDVTVSDENTISIDTSTQTINSSSDWNNWDILVTPEVTASAASPTISFTGDNAFKHIMSKMTFTFVAAGGLSDLSLLTGYGLRELVTEASFDTKSCTLTNGSTKASISKDISSTSGATSVTCDPIILLPQTLTNGKFTLDVTYDGKVYSTELSLPSDATSSTALTAGEHYTYTLTITGLEVVSASIADWNTDEMTGEATLNYTFTTDEDTGTRSYTVYTEAGLNAWATYVNNGNWDANCTLASNITMEDYWTPVGDSDNQYTGTFDGNNKTITGLTISATNTGERNCVGLIGNLGSDGVVKDLTLTNVNVSYEWGWSVAAVVGQNVGGAISNCHVTGSVSGAGFVGGIVGSNYNVTDDNYAVISEGPVTNCSFSGTVSSVVNKTNDGGLSGGQSIGGVIGVNYGGTITACYFTGDISVTGESNSIGYIGGVIGNNNYGKVYACYSTGTISSVTDYVGGVAGYNHEWSTISACYSTASVSSTYGGSYIGGVAGYNYSNGIISTCYWYNSGTTYGIGYDVSSTSGINTNATYVDGSSDNTWSDAASTMNSTLSNAGISWEYTGDGTSDPPLTLQTSN